MEEVFGPVLVVLPFRTAKEAIAIANNTLYGLGASVHSEQARKAGGRNLQKDHFNIVISVPPETSS